MLKYNKKELKTYRTTVLQVQPSMRLSVAKHPGADTGKKLTSPKFPRFPILSNVSPTIHNVSPIFH